MPRSAVEQAALAFRDATRREYRGAPVAAPESRAAWDELCAAIDAAAFDEAQAASRPKRRGKVVRLRAINGGRA